jgi:hypothetical protein
MKKFGILIVAAIYCLVCGCAATYNGDIEGVITNLKDVNQHLTKDPYLQIIEFPEYELYKTELITAYNKYIHHQRSDVLENITMSFNSDREKIGISQNGKFKIHVEKLPTGKYVLIAQPIIGSFPAIFCDDKQKTRIIDILKDLQSPFILDLKKGILRIDSTARIK